MYIYIKKNFRKETTTFCLCNYAILSISTIIHQRGGFDLLVFLKSLKEVQGFLLCLTTLHLQSTPPSLQAFCGPKASF